MTMDNHEIKQRAEATARAVMEEQNRWLAHARRIFKFIRHLKGDGFEFTYPKLQRDGTLSVKLAKDEGGARWRWEVDPTEARLYRVIGEGKHMRKEFIRSERLIEQGEQT